MTAAPELPRNLAGRQLGRYEVLTQLASGGMAAVYVARAKGVAGFERLVAVKVLHPHLAYEAEFISMFLDEARLAARIRHPNVVPTLDISDTEGDGFFLVMEYIEGDHFGAVLGAAARDGQRLPTPVVSRIVLDALGGLEAAHGLLDEQGQPLRLVHRDVSPHNIMVGADGIARLTDFGVAKAEKRLSSTRVGQFKGKLAYMSPEQASSGFAEQSSDLFSMGIILWEALTGRRLFRGENNAATLNNVLNVPIEMPSRYWPELAPFDAVLHRALSREVATRYQSADEMAADLEDIARASEGVASPRDVAATVRHWLTEKLDEQRTRITDATARLGHSDFSESAIPVPIESSSSALRPSPAVVSTPESHTASEIADMRPGNRWALGAAGLVVLLGVGFATYALGVNAGVEPSVALPVDRATVVEPLAPAPAPVPIEQAPSLPEPMAQDEDPSPDTRGDRSRGMRRAGRMARPEAEPEPDEVEPSPEVEVEVATEMVEAPVPTEMIGGMTSEMDTVADDVLFNPYRQ